MTFGTVCSGIGAPECAWLPLGWKSTFASEIEAFPRAVLKKHWPEVPQYDDVRTLTADRLRAGGISVDVICGGFPCQDISLAGKGGGLAGERSGLWQDYARLIDEIRPAWVIIENVPALRSRGLDQVLRTIAAFGYDAEWHCIPAAAIGAPHRRDRVWIIAHTDHGEGRRFEPQRIADRGDTDIGGDGSGGVLADAARHERSGERQALRWARQRVGADSEGRGGAVGFGAIDGEDAGICAPELADAPGEGRQAGPRCEIGSAGEARRIQSAGLGGDVADAGQPGLSAPEQPGRREPLITAADIRRAASECYWRRTVAGLGGVADGIPVGMDRYPSAVEAWEVGVPRTVISGTPGRVPRLRALGNAVVPQIPELIGRAILAYIAAQQHAA